MRPAIKFLTLILIAFAVPASAQGIFRVDSVPDDGLPLPEKWKFHAGDDSAWAGPAWDDSQWKEDSTVLNSDTEFKGAGWFRLHLRFDSALDRLPLSLVLEQTGASEIYVNGEVVMKFGKFSADGLKEKRYNPQGFPVQLNHDHKRDLLIAVRYSNHRPEDSFDDQGNKIIGFRAYLFQSTPLLRSLINQYNNFGTVSSFLFGFFVALGLSHLFVFLFYRKYRSNLYYFIFILLLSHYILFLYFTVVVTDFALSRIYYMVSYFLFPFFFVSLLTLVYSVMGQRFTRFYRAIFILAVITAITQFFQFRYMGYLIFTVAFSCTIASIFVIVRSIRQKKKGARIVGTGFLTFAAFVLLVLAMIFLTGGFYVRGDSFLGILLIISCLLSIMSIPIFMSVYLAWDFSRTSRDLEMKLVEVEALSAKTLEQEKEKQRILETQNETLEIQVKERTHEIEEQKKVIEEKNKDITDSINYAKRIQDAILPSKELKRQLFPESFVLFKPKDIVSGDFYYFAKAEGWDRSHGNGKRIIAAVDCTGHGVPGALMSVIGNNVLNQVVLEHGITRPAEVLQRLDAGVRALLKKNKEGQAQDGMDIALCCFDGQPDNYAFEYAGAQRPLWIVRHDTGQPEEIKADKFSIGGTHAGDKKIFTNHTVRVKKGDCIYIFSDGYADQFGGNEGKKFMSRKFKDLLASIHQLPMDEQEKALDDAIEKWRGNTVQVDDILVIGVRI